MMKRKLLLAFLLAASISIATAAYFPAVKIVDKNGVAQGIDFVGSRPLTSAVEFHTDLGRLLVPGATAVRLSGWNGDVDNTKEDIWEVGGIYTFPSVASQVRVVSTSGSDASGSTGIWQVMIVYLNASYNSQVEILVLNGTTPVNSVATDVFRINNFHAMSAGSGKVAAGNITVQNLAGTTSYSQISANQTESRQAIFTVPAGKTLYINKGFTSVYTAGNYVDISINSNNDYILNFSLGTFFLTLGNFMLINGGPIVTEFNIPLRFPAQTDVKGSAVSTSAAANSVVSVILGGWLE